MQQTNLTFDKSGNLFSYEVIEIDNEAFKTHFVDAFPKS